MHFITQRTNGVYVNEFILDIAGIPCEENHTLAIFPSSVLILPEDMEIRETLQLMIGLKMLQNKFSELLVRDCAPGDGEDETDSTLSITHYALQKACKELAQPFHGERREAMDVACAILDELELQGMSMSRLFSKLLEEEWAYEG